MKRFKVWNGGVSAVAAVIVFILTYMLILPAITMTKDPTCGMEEHTHSPKCYETRTVRKLACPYDEFDGLVLHKHDENCYNEAGELICKLEETLSDDQLVEEQEDILTVEDVLVQAEPTLGPAQELAAEEEAVAAEEAADETVAEEEPLLATEETAVLEEPALVEEEEIALAGEEAALAEEDVLLAEEMEESDQEEEDITHLHTADCYDVFGNLICGKQQVVYHQHDESCFELEEEEVLICGKQEHVHTDECYTVVEEYPGDVVSPVSEETEDVVLDGMETSEEGVVAEEDAVLAEEEAAPIEYITQEVKSEETEDGIVFFLEPKAEVEEEATLEASEEDGFETAEQDEEDSLVIVEEEASAEPEDVPSDGTPSVEEEALDEESMAEATEDEDLMATEEEPQDIAEEELVDGTAEDAVLGEEETVSDEEAGVEEAEEESTVLEEDAELTEEDLEADVDDGLVEEGSEDIVLDEKPDQKNLIYNGLDYHVTLSYLDGIPDGATLDVREIKGAEFDSYLTSAKESLGAKVIPASLARFFDITILLDGDEIEPSGPVQVQISYDDPVQVNGKLNVIHFEDEEKITVFSADDAEDVTEEGFVTEAEDIQEEASEDELEEDVEAVLEEEAAEEETEVSFEAESFSVYGVVYTLDFQKVEGGTYRMEGARVGLGILLYSLGFEDKDLDQIITAEFSNPDVISVYKDEDGQWYLESIRPFDSEELLSVYFMDGTLIDVKIEDAQMWTYYLDAEGDTYYISVTYDESANIPDDAELVVREIREGTLEYEECMKQTRSQMDESETVQMAKFFDITIMSKGAEVHPDSPVEVKIKLEEEISDRIRTLRISNENEVDELENECQDDNTVMFKAEGF